MSAERTVFIDDSEANVRPAQKLGFHGIQFRCADALLETLARMRVVSTQTQ